MLFWTKDKCQEEALKYIYRSDFKKHSISAYEKSMDNLWLDEVCSHMSRKMKWSKEKCKIEALKYHNIRDLISGNKAVYDKIKREKWESLFAHMIELIKPAKYWNKEKCKEEASKYNSRSEFKRKNGSSYQSALKNKWLDEICSHMITTNVEIKRCVYLYEFSDNYVYIGLTGNIKIRKNQHENDIDSPVYKHSIESGLKPTLKKLSGYLNECEAVSLEQEYIKKHTNHNKLLNTTIGGELGSNILFWTKERCRVEALKYSRRNDFRIKSNSAYSSSRIHYWLDEVCSHMVKKYTKIL